MKSIVLYLFIVSGIVMGMESASQVIWIEAEDFDPDRSALQSGEVNLTWLVKEKDDQAKDAFGDKYILASGSHNKTASSGPVYALPEIDERPGWVLWARRIMPTTGSDSFFYEVRDDDKWEKPPANQLSGLALEWEWGKGNNTLTIDKGEGNFLRISERESNFSIDVLCLRNDGMTPTDEEYEKYLEDEPRRRFAVDPGDKLTATWANIKIR
jgi:hypothetical protein